MASERDRPRSPEPDSPVALRTPRYISILFMLCWLLAIWGVVSGVFALYFIVLVAVAEGAERIGSWTGLPGIADLAVLVALLLAFPLAVLLLVCLPLCALVIVLQHRRPPPQRNRRLLKTALLVGAIASFIGFTLGGAYGTMMLFVGFTPWAEGARAGILVVGSALAFTSGFRALRYFRSL